MGRSDPGKAPHDPTFELRYEIESKSHLMQFISGRNIITLFLSGSLAGEENRLLQLVFHAKCSWLKCSAPVFAEPVSTLSQSFWKWEYYTWKGILQSDVYDWPRRISLTALPLIEHSKKLTIWHMFWIYRIPCPGTQPSLSSSDSEYFAIFWYLSNHLDIMMRY